MRSVLWMVVLCGLLGVPAAAQTGQRYVICPEKSEILFQAYSLFARPLGRFHRFSGEIVANAENLAASGVRLTIEAASIDTGNARRDRHLRSEDFLFVERYPRISFTSTRIVRTEQGFDVEGDLEIRGVTRRLSVPVRVEQRARVMVVQGAVRLDREAFGITYNAFFNPIQEAVDVRFTIVGVAPGSKACG